MIAVSTILANLQKELGSFYSTEAHTSWDLLRYINSSARAIVTARNFWFNKYTQSISILPEWTVTTDPVWVIEWFSWDTISVPYQIETFYILDSAWDEVNIYNFEDYYLLKDKSEAIMIEEDKLVSEMEWDFTIYYRGYPTTVTSTDWNLNMPQHFFDMIVLMWTYYGLMDIRAYDKANYKKWVFEWMVKDVAKRESDKKPLQTKRLNKSPSKIW